MATFQFKTVSKSERVVEVTLEAEDGLLTIGQIKKFLDDLTAEFYGGNNRIVGSAVKVSERGLTVKLEPISED